MLAQVRDWASVEFCTLVTKSCLNLLSSGRRLNKGKVLKGPKQPAVQILIQAFSCFAGVVCWLVYLVDRCISCGFSLISVIRKMV